MLRFIELYWRRPTRFPAWTAAFVLAWGCGSRFSSSAPDVGRDGVNETTSAKGSRGIAGGLTGSTKVERGSLRYDSASRADGSPEEKPVEMSGTGQARSGRWQPALNDELQRLRRAAAEDVLGSDCPPGAYALPYARIEGEPGARAGAVGSEADDRTPPWLGHFVPIENEGALYHFHEALARLAAGKDEDGRVRILAYGASHTEADTYTGYLRGYLQSRFGGGGQGFVLLGQVNRWYRTLDTRVRHRHLTVHHARYREDMQEEPLGLFGAALVGRHAPGFGEIVTSKDSPNTRFEVQYYTEPSGGNFTLQIDGKRIARIQTKSEKPGPAYYSFEATPGSHTIRAELAGEGPVRLFGIVAETANPGVVVDTLGIGGAQVGGNLRWQEDAWIDAVHHRNPDLITLAYGTNEMMDCARPITSYEAQLRTVLGRVRKAAPQASCLLIGPFEVPKANRDRFSGVIDVQRRISKELGCGFWDGYAFMGGPGSMRTWIAAKPPLASIDHVHLTKLGYVYAGIAIGDALMRAYDSAPAHFAEPASVAPPSSTSP